MRLSILFLASLQQLQRFAEVAYFIQTAEVYSLLNRCELVGERNASSYR